MSCRFLFYVSRRSLAYLFLSGSLSQSSIASFSPVWVVTVSVADVPPLAKHLLQRRAGLHGGHNLVCVQQTLETAEPTRQPHRDRLLSLGKYREVSARRCTMPPLFMFVTRYTVSLSSTTSLFSRCVLDRNAHGFGAKSSGGFPLATVLVILNTEGSVQNRCMHVHVEVRTTSVQVYMHTHMGRSKPWKRLRAMNFFSRMLTMGAS